MLEAIKDPEIVVEATMQPIRRFGFDAAILFSDLTLPFTAMGAPFEIGEGVGPVIGHPIRNAADLEALHLFEPEEDLPYVFSAIRELRRQLTTPLIGFTGAPFTWACYLIEGGPSRDLKRTKAMLYGEPELWRRLMELLSRVIARYLAAQIEAGAQAVQIFDSWVGHLSPETYRSVIQPHMKGILETLRPLGAPIILFGTGNPMLLEAMAECRPDVLGVDWRVSLSTVAKLTPGLPLQGNLDPAILLTDPATIKARALEVLEEGRQAPSHIFNLGHGIYPETPLENVERLMTTVVGSS
jgi:uroporphyrinogen decarboxylase